MYGKPSCVQCDATERYLKSHHIPYRKIDVTQDESALQKIKDMGYQQAPVVMVPFDWECEARHWSGFQPDLLKSLR